MASNVGHERIGRRNVSTCQPRFWWCSCWGRFGERQHVLLVVGNLQSKQLSSDGDADADLLSAVICCGTPLRRACRASVSWVREKATNDVRLAGLGSTAVCKHAKGEGIVSYPFLGKLSVLGKTTGGDQGQAHAL